MKKFVLFFVALVTASTTFGSLTGIYYIPSGPGSTYPNIALAIADLNTLGVSGTGATFYINAGYIENITTTLSLTATGTASSPIVFMKNPLTAGPNPVINVSFLGSNTPNMAITDGVWNLIGSDYVTIDGIDLVDPNASNPASMEYGFAMFKQNPTDGCQHNTIQNCTVTLNRINNASGSGPSLDGSKAISVVNALATNQIVAVTTLAASGSNSFNQFFGNTLQNCNIGIALVGYAAVSPFTEADQNNDIGGTTSSTGNVILNYGGAPGATNPAAGIRTQNQYGLNVSYNTVNNNNGSGVSHSSTLRGIYLQAATSASATISNNTLTITGGSTTSQISVIENVSGSTAAGNTINISNNIIQNCSWPTATSGAFYGIWNSSTAATVNISNNIISSINIPNTATSDIIRGGGPPNLNIFNNEIGNITKAASGTLYAMRAEAGVATLSVHENSVQDLFMGSGGNAIYGFYTTASPSNESYYGNTFSHFTNNGTGGLFGIYTNTAAGTRNVYSNTIHSFSATGGGTVYGIYGASSSPSIYKNRIFDLSSGTASGTVSGSLYGIYIVSGNPINIYNNYVSDLKTPSATANVLSGIYVSTSAVVTANIYYNTVFLNGTSTGAPFNSAALYTNTTPTVDVRNNILINNSTPTGTGIAAAYRRNTTALTTYATTSNNNNFNAGSPDATHVIFFDGTTVYPTLTAFQTLVGPTRDAASFTENSPFVNVSANDFHINTSVSTLCESGGVRVTSPPINVVDDYDGDIRWGETGYIGNGIAPDVGADEFEGNNPLWCFPPTGITVFFISPSSVTISWIPPIPPPGVAYEYEVRTSGSPGSGPPGLFVSGATVGTTVSATGLVGSTTYYVYVRSNCGNGIFSPWTPGYPFTTPSMNVISGLLSDSLNIAIPEANVYIRAHPPCYPDDTLTTTNGGITYSVVNGIGTYTVYYNNFIHPPTPGTQVYVSFHNTATQDFEPAKILILPGSVTPYNAVIHRVRHVILAEATLCVTVVIPAHTTLKIHYTHVNWCGNTDVVVWNSITGSWEQYRSWNWNWDWPGWSGRWKYIQNNGNTPMVVCIHNDDHGVGTGMEFDLIIDAPASPTTISNSSTYAVLNLGCRNRPFISCEFGDIYGPAHSFFYHEGASLVNFPSRLAYDGIQGVQNLTIQFESYDNIYWSDMSLMIDLVNVTQPGTLEMSLPDATIPFHTALINSGDTVCYFNPGGILAPGMHTMTLTVTGGLSMGIDCFNFTSRVSLGLPTVMTAPVMGITPTSAISGGTVIADGGAPVTARGVCWSTMPNPTLLDNFTTDGSGLGTYTSTMSPLIPSTLYFVRSYATNMAGTAYGDILPFTTEAMPIIITGTIFDSLGVSPPPENVYIVAHRECNPTDTLSTLNGGIIYSGGGGGGAGTYSVQCNNFLDPPTPGERVFIFFHNTATLEFAPEMVEVGQTPITIFNPVIRLARHVHLPFKTSWVRVIVPPHRTLQIHYTFVHGCGNTDVFEWNGIRWTKFRQWNFNHYCTWRYIYNNSNKPKVYVIHNDNGNIKFDMMFFCPINLITSPSNNNVFALFNMGWRDRPYPSCEFGNIIATNYSFFDFEGAFLDQFPQRLGTGGVENLAIQFESYSNNFWNDMNLMIDLSNVTQPGTLELFVPDATIPLSTAVINPGDTAVFFHTGGILTAGPHTMTLSATGGLSICLDGLIYTTLVPVPDLPTISTAPVTSIMPTSAISGGNVIADGGAEVTARGVCWSTTANPTILDNITVDGSGLGMYTSLMSPLLPSTTYHMRAYATNLSGTAYGEELTFTTLILVPDFRTVQNVTVASGQSVCYDAIYTITVAGDNTFFAVEPSGSAIFAAGQNIRYLPDTWVKYGAYMRGFIDLSGAYCSQFPGTDATVISGEGLNIGCEHAFFRIYPNPTTGNFTLEQKGDQLYPKLTVEIYSMRGEKVFKTVIFGEKKHEFQFSEIPTGLYFVKILTKDYIETIKLIKTN